MTTKDSFRYKGNYCTYHDCHFVTSRYCDNYNLYLGVVSETEGLICTCSVNTTRKLDDDRIAVKNYSENTGMVERLVGLGIIEEKADDYIPSGFVWIPVHKLTASGLELFKDVPKGCED